MFNCCSHKDADGKDVEGGTPSGDWFKSLAAYKKAMVLALGNQELKDLTTNK